MDLLHFIHNICSIFNKSFKKKSEVLYHFPLTFHHSIFSKNFPSALVVAVLLEQRSFTFQCIQSICCLANSQSHKETNRATELCHLDPIYVLILSKIQKTISTESNNIRLCERVPVTQVTSSMM